MIDRSLMKDEETAGTSFPEVLSKLDVESLEKLSRDLVNAGALSGVLKDMEGQRNSGLAFVLKNLCGDEIKKILNQVDLVLPLPADSIEMLKVLEDLVAWCRRLADLSVRDPLTSLFNLRHFKSQLRVEMDRVKRSEHPCCLMMIDLDNFKPVNDTYGHQVGNEVLAGAARIILNAVRTVDVVARYGGDEFAVILPDTRAGSALKLAERICRAFQDDPQTSRYGITGSFGLAAYHYLDSLDPETFIEHADRAMYQAKRNGGNQVSIFKEDLVVEESTEVTASEKQALFGNSGNKR